jgi:hypothetical protein
MTKLNPVRRKQNNKVFIFSYPVIKRGMVKDKIKQAIYIIVYNLDLHPQL